MSPPAGPAEIAACLPHGGPARWVDRVERLDGESIVCSGRAPAGCPFVTVAAGGDAELPAFVTVELAAQAAALLESLPAGGAGDAGTTAAGDAALARGGFLVRVRRLRIDRPRIAAGERLTATVTRAGARPPLHLYHVRVEAGGAPVLEGGIAVYEDAAG